MSDKIQDEINRLTTLIDEMETSYQKLKRSSNKKNIKRIKLSVKIILDGKTSSSDKLNKIVAVLETAFKKSSRSYTRFRLGKKFKHFIERLKKPKDRRFHYPRMLGLILKGHYIQREKLNLSDTPLNFKNNVKEIPMPEKYNDSPIFLANDKLTSSNDGVNSPKNKYSKTDSKTISDESDENATFSGEKMVQTNTPKKEKDEDETAASNLTPYENASPLPKKVKITHNEQGSPKSIPKQETARIKSPNEKWYVSLIVTMLTENNLTTPETIDQLLRNFFPLVNSDVDLQESGAALRFLDQFRRRLALATRNQPYGFNLDYFTLLRMLIPSMIVGAKLEFDAAVWNDDYKNKFKDLAIELYKKELEMREQTCQSLRDKISPPITAAQNHLYELEIKLEKIKKSIHRDETNLRVFKEELKELKKLESKSQTYITSAREWTLTSYINNLEKNISNNQSQLKQQELACQKIRDQISPLTPNHYILFKMEDDLIKLKRAFLANNFIMANIMESEHLKALEFDVDFPIEEKERSARLENLKKYIKPEDSEQIQNNFINQYSPFFNKLLQLKNDLKTFLANQPIDSNQELKDLIESVAPILGLISDITTEIFRPFQKNIFWLVDENAVSELNKMECLPKEKISKEISHFLIKHEKLISILFSIKDEDYLTINFFKPPSPEKKLVNYLIQFANSQQLLLEEVDKTLLLNIGYRFDLLSKLGRHTPPR